MSKRLTIISIICAVVFNTVSMWVMWDAAKHKAINIKNVAQDQVTETDDQMGLKDEVRQSGAGELRFRQDLNTEYLSIPLEAGISADKISIENHYMDHEIWIYIYGASADFYEQEALDGNISQIISSQYEAGLQDVLLKFYLNDVYECISVFDANHLNLTFKHPKDVYEHIVVLDASCGGTDQGITINGISEKNITLDIIRQLKEKMVKSEVKIYYTRTEDIDRTQEERVCLANAVHADLFISVRANVSEDTSLYGTESYYNHDYFIPEFGSVELADLLEFHIVTQISGKANGLIPATKTDYCIKNAKVPAATVAVGYLSNEKEANLLNQEAYRGKIAEGIYQTIKEFYE